MVNEKSLENLKVPSSIEAAIYGSKGGIASGKSRLRKTALKELIANFVVMPVADTKTVGKLSAFFPELEPDALNYISLAFMRVIQDMTASSTKPIDRIKIIEFIRDTMGQKPVENIKIDDTKAEEYHIDKVLSENFTDDELVEMLKNMYKNDDNKGEN